MGSEDRGRRRFDALVYEGQQAWEHYRHVESERNQFLGFFFTLAVAVAGIAIAFVPSADGDNWRWVVVGIAIASALVTVLGFIILVSVRRFGNVLAYYDRDISEIREDLFREFSELEARVGKRLDSQPQPLGPRMNWIRGAQGASELAVVVLDVMFALISVTAFASSLFSGGYDWGQQLILGCIAALVSVVAGAALVVFRTSWRPPG